MVLNNAYQKGCINRPTTLTHKFVTLHTCSLGRDRQPLSPPEVKGVKVTVLPKKILDRQHSKVVLNRTVGLNTLDFWRLLVKTWYCFNKNTSALQQQQCTSSVTHETWNQWPYKALKNEIAWVCFSLVKTYRQYHAIYTLAGFCHVC